MRTGTILDQIAEKKRETVRKRLESCSLEEYRKRALESPMPSPSFREAIAEKGHLHIIAEVKKASPSNGVIQSQFHPVRQALDYQRAGASAISVLTEEHYFLGKDEYLQTIKQYVELPVLRKDFIIDASQIFEARILGASAILLIAALLSDEELACFLQEAQSMGLDVLLEVHNEEELERAIKLDAPLIGINNRDLKTFAVDLNTTQRLAARVPEGKVIVSESGIHSKEDIALVRRAGVHAAVIGESLMRSAGFVDEKLKELLGDTKA